MIYTTNWIERLNRDYKRALNMRGTNTHFWKHYPAEKIREVPTTFYYDAPAGGEYVFGSPLMDRAAVNMGDERTFTVLAHNNSRENKYIQSARLNGEEYSKSFINHSDVVTGGALEFWMGDKPSTFGTAKKDRHLN